MDEAIEELVIDVRASTDGFAQDLAGISNTIDTTLVASFDRAGQNIERGLIASLRRGSLGFDDLKRIAFRALDDIAAHADAIAIRIAGDWSFVEPPPGMRVWDQSLQQSLLFNNAWLGLTPPSVSVGGDVVDEQARLAIDELIQVLRIAGVFAKL